MADFIEDLLLDFAAYGFRSKRTWATDKAQTRNRVKRNATRTRPYLSFVAPYDRLSTPHRQRLVEQFDACMGSLYSFRFRDKAENRALNVVIGTAVGGGETMQLIKPPAQAFGGYSFNRVIKKPADSTVFNIANGYHSNAIPLELTQDTGGGPVPLACTCDYTTGIVTFNATAGAVIQASFEFHVPVYFADDELDSALTTFEAHSLEILLQEDPGA
jgi:uncharacterized protein (TIGR02217 family)